MSQNFGALFRSSSFASLAPPVASQLAVPVTQALTAPLAHRNNGNWGLKRSLPSGKGAEHPWCVAVSDHDHPWTKTTRYQSAAEPVNMLRRWAELMPPVTAVPPSRAEALATFVNDAQEGAVLGTETGDQGAAPLRPRDTDSMTSEEWRELIKTARASRDRYLAIPELERPSWDEFLNVLVHPKTQIELQSARPGVPIHPPTYAIGEADASSPTIVKGRLLNSFASKQGRYSVGVGGIVAYAPSLGQSQSNGRGNDFSNVEGYRTELKDYEVKHASFDDKGRPLVVIQLYSPATHATGFSTSPVGTFAESSVDMIANREVEQPAKGSRDPAAPAKTLPFLAKAKPSTSSSAAILSILNSFTNHKKPSEGDK
ncbi:hypothetical protein HKX48_006943 [Thoreauomyces humboldtii]|nr:hypothetical protein HKX48_006943 [Thoreauomyces humboldtii]